MDDLQQNNKNLSPRPVPPPRPAPPPRPMPPPKPPVFQTESVQEIKEENQEIIAENNSLITDKKEKSKKEKNKKKINKKLILISSLCLIGVIIIGFSALTIINVIKESKKIETPTNLIIYEFNEEKYLKVDENSRAEKYLFKRIFNDEEVTIQSNVAGINLSPYLLEAGEYKFSVQYLGKRDKADSDFCEEIIYENFIELNKPIVVYDKELNKLVWVPVENATSYNIHYMTPLGIANYYSYNAPQSKENVEFDLSIIFNENVAGSYEISVEAVGGEYYKSSKLSNKIIVNNGTQLLPVTEIKYNKETRVLEFTSDTQTNRYNIKITLNQYENNLIELTYKSEENINLINLSTYVSGLVKRIEIVALGDGVYTFDSNSSSIDIE